MAKAEIGWTRKNAEGIKIDVYARRVGDQWLFYQRERRYDRWEIMENPPGEDWMILLEAVERRLARKLVRPEEVIRLRKWISERFPDLLP
ncbi:MAG TPA: hypothetical protein P5186_24510 [Candidatus Paceibacterota bacterium]|nr:hypothetical protein [Verrucomicrobiota bacterium]HRY51226.1 hypothetical protein [Candidatus Paceibacterota bacterium]HSA00433.1 hypothetical protein [Candidatus Paceibacterota bacterium]